MRFSPFYSFSAFSSFCHIHPLAARTNLLFVKETTPEQIQARMDAYSERLVNPQQALVEAEMRALLPQKLIAMYSDRELVLSQTSTSVRQEGSQEIE